jgi:hypothetical protein
MPRARLSGYLSRANSCMTGAGFISFMPLLKSSINTGSALMIRPAQTIFFETGAIGVPDCMDSSSRCLSLFPATITSAQRQERSNCDPEGMPLITQDKDSLRRS